MPTISNLAEAPRRMIALIALVALAGTMAFTLAMSSSASDRAGAVSALTLLPPKATPATSVPKPTNSTSGGLPIKPKPVG